MNQFLMDVAFAQAAGGKPAQPGMFDMLIMFLPLIAIMYFMVIRPQQKRHKEQKELVENLKVGDEVVTSGGIIGRIKAVADQFVTLEAGVNTFLKVQKQHISAATKPKVEATK